MYPKQQGDTHVYMSKIVYFVMLTYWTRCRYFNGCNPGNDMLSKWVVAKVQKMALHIKNQKIPSPGTHHKNRTTITMMSMIRFSSIGTSKTIHIKLETPFII